MTTINGAAIMVMAAEAEQPSPVVGSRPCRITRPLHVRPDYVGRFGRAWRVNLVAARKGIMIQPGMTPDALVAHWVLEAPWSSQVVHSYSWLLIHLRFAFDKPVRKYLPDATHELALLALHPEADRAAMLGAPTDLNAWLRPPVFAAHIAEKSDEAAVTRAFRAIELVCAGRLSPHPTHIRAWAELFGGNMMMEVAAQAAAVEKEGQS